jgi:hypothetical protein
MEQVDLLRAYFDEELRKDGYPKAWPEINALVVEIAGSRCIRCGHPYRKGEHGNGEWSPCDEHCTHTSGNVTSVWFPGGTPETHEGEEDGFYVRYAQWRILTVHHLTGCWGKTHEAKADCRWWNLLALCQRCHLQIQGKVDPFVPWPWEHSTWFKPYVAGFYAWHLLTLELTREETEARQEELLALGKRMAALERMPV